MILHVLPGDAIVETFRDANIEGDIAVRREALVDGDVSGDTLPEFWENRSRSFAEGHSGEAGDYHENVVGEFAKLTALQSGSEINLWFEYELFCQANMWFCLSLLKDSTAGIFRVAPVTQEDKQIWDGFGTHTPEDLRKCFSERVKMTADEIGLGAELWDAYRKGEHARLRTLSTTASPAFPKLREVSVAAIEKDSRPKQIIADIVQEGESEFENIFRKFKSRAGVYGYGDAQVKKIWQKLVV